MKRWWWWWWKWCDLRFRVICDQAAGVCGLRLVSKYTSSIVIQSPSFGDGSSSHRFFAGTLLFFSFLLFPSSLGAQDLRNQLLDPICLPIFICIAPQLINRIVQGSSQTITLRALDRVPCRISTLFIATTLRKHSRYAVPRWRG